MAMQSVIRKPSAPRLAKASIKRGQLQTVRFQPSDAPRVPEVVYKRVLKGPCVVDLEGTRLGNVPVARHTSPNCTLTEYMSHAAEHFSNIPLPLGGKLIRVDSGRIEMIVPKIEIFDIWLQPKAMTNVKVYNDRAEITSTTADCVLTGSHHVTQLGLNERYNLDVRIIFTWDDQESKSGPKIYVNGKIKVEVDIPAPFSFMPKGVLKAAGDTAMNAVLSVMMPTFLDILAKQYNQWAIEAAKK